MSWIMRFTFGKGSTGISSHITLWQLEWFSEISKGKIGAEVYITFSESKASWHSFVDVIFFFLCIVLSPEI